MLITSELLLQVGTNRLEGHGQPSAELQLDWLKLRSQLFWWRPGECPSDIHFPVLSKTARRRRLAVPGEAEQKPLFIESFPFFCNWLERRRPVYGKATLVASPHTLNFFFELAKRVPSGTCSDHSS